MLRHLREDCPYRAKRFLASSPQLKKRRLVVARLLLFSLCLWFLGLSAAPVLGDETSQEIIKAVSNLTDTRSQAMILKHIDEIHLLRGMGKISNSQYQNVMAWHQSINLLIAHKAMDTLKLYSLMMQKTAPDAEVWRIGSDTDFLVSRKDGRPITLEDIQAIERAYRVQTNIIIRKLGGGTVKPSPERFDTNTDFMVAHDATTPEEFARIATHFTYKNAGTYHRIEAARAEALMRTPGAHVDYLDGRAYVAEMVDQASRKQRYIDEMLALRVKASQNERERIDARIKQLAYERDKYVKRINSMNQRLGEQLLPSGKAPGSVPKVVGMQNLAVNARRSFAQTLGNLVAVLP